MDENLVECKTVSFGVIAYNEEKHLPALLENLLGQSYPKSNIELVLVDGGSADATKEIMQSFRQEHLDEYIDIKVLDNPKKIQPAGWNIVILQSTGDVVLRIDAHAKLPDNFIEANMTCINSGECVCGGPRTNIIDEPTAWKRMLLDAEQSLFGSGVAPYRRGTRERKYVKSLFHGAYRCEVFEKVGLFNESLARTEDNELHYRVRQSGYRLCYDCNIQSYYQTRNSLREMIRQKYGNGLWVGKTLFVCPRCISIFHLVPFAFVLACAAGGILWGLGLWQWMALLAGAYGLFVVLNTIACMVTSKNALDLALPLVYLMLHLAYGIGTSLGIIGGVLQKQ